MTEILYDRQQRALGREINSKLQELVVGIICEESLLLQEVVKQLSLVGVKQIHLFMKSNFEPTKLTSVTQYIIEEGLNNVAQVNVLITSDVHYANQFYSQTKVVYIDQQNIIHVKEPLTITEKTKKEFYNDLLVANLFMYWLCNLVSGQVQNVQVELEDQIKVKRL